MPVRILALIPLWYGILRTKHIYAGTTRLVSKLVKQDTPNGNPQGATPYEKDLYFYHPDHLGTSNYITDTQGKLYEHLEYFPFGEGWVEENSNTQRTPYLFTAKELDEETGLYYFGARYYDPRTSVWQSPDRILNSYLPMGERANELPGMGGIYNPYNLGLYSYGHLNPLKYNDPDGNVPLDTIVDIGYMFYDAGRVLGASAAYVVGAVSGDTSLKAVALEGLKETSLDFAASTAGAVTPYIPATITRGARTAMKIVDEGKDAAKAAKELHRPYIRKSTRDAVEQAAPKTKEGKFIDPNTGKPIEGKHDLGHKSGQEFRREKAKAEKEGLSQKEFNERMNDPNKYQIEDPSSNRSHRYEKPGND